MYSYPGSKLKRPYPSHTLTPDAEAGRQTLRDYGLKRRHDRDAGNVQLVIHHVKPWAQIDVSELVGAPALFAKAALAAGREVAAKRAGDAVCVAVMSRPKLRGVTALKPFGEKGKGYPQIRAYWKAGRSTGVLLDGHKVAVTAAKAALS